MSAYEKLTDEQLIGKLRDGEREITDYIMEKYKNLVRREAKAMYLLGGDSDDLIQEGMIGLFKAVRDFDVDQGVPFFGFAKLCVRRQMYSAIEASQRMKHLPLNSYISLYEKADEDGKARILDTIVAGDESNPETAMIGRESTEQIYEELEKELSEFERKVLDLHLQGLGYREIAKRIGKTPKSADNALQRIRAKLGKIMDQNG